jgi:hypothetical protein
MFRKFALVFALAALAGCSDSGAPIDPIDTRGELAAAAGPSVAGKSAGTASMPSSATLTFGRTGVGSPFPAPAGHDASIHAYDKILPHVVNIAAGGSVTTNLGPLHGAAVYDRGTLPRDIDLSPALLDDLAVPFPPGVLTDFIITDPTNRLAASPTVTVAPTTWTTPPGTFDQPGRYLVICVVAPHFQFAKMYAYVNVH